MALAYGSRLARTRSLRVRADRITWLTTGRSERSPNADLVEVVEQVLRIVVDPVGARADQLFAPVAAGEQTDAERARSSRGQQVPDAVADDHAGADLGPDPLGRGQEQIRVRLGVADLVARHKRRLGRQAQELEREPGIALAAARRDRPANPVRGERRQQVGGAG